MDHLRLEVHYSHAAELAARDLPEHVLTMRASGLARIEIVGGRTARSHVIAAGGFCLAPAGPTDVVRWNALRTLFVIALAPRWMDALAGENQRSQVALRGAVGVRDPLKLLAASVVRCRSVPPSSKVSKQWPRSFGLRSDAPSRRPNFRKTPSPITKLCSELSQIPTT
jgi:hypothetical protein